ncbi:hypothetical protein Q31b_42630 [Novipirellula aureliae]|uniref:Uncharacterized protein n=1 Tax=Novipirellula aureliae TaxID=2527966 RepID=A0A5C6DMU1_9BACT|nr:hypothetical protein [Novipirellula aureliae]TWU37475.1 hypothetical protein Q31b_42630 [Novipirellula aureliae]
MIRVFALVWAVLLCLLSGLGRTADGAEPSPPVRSYFEAISGYMDAESSWQTYIDATNTMQQEVEYTKRDFYAMGIKTCDATARKADSLRRAYELYSGNLRVLKLEPKSVQQFASLAISEQNALLESSSDAAARWGEYSRNMSQMGLVFHKADAYMKLTADKRRKLHEQAVGTQQSVYQYTSGCYDGKQGWETYSSCRSEMGLGTDYSQFEFINLSIDDIDRLARSAKYERDGYSAYRKALRRLDIAVIEQKEFASLTDAAQEQLVAASLDSAAKWPDYNSNMKRMGKSSLRSKEFFQLAAVEREQLWSRSVGTTRTSWQVTRGYYASDDGWKAYQTSLNELGIALAHDEFEFINLDIESIDRLARHAVESLHLFRELNTIHELARMPIPYTKTEIYETADLGHWQKLIDARLQEWTPRIVYDQSCKNLGRTPDWALFNRSSFNAQQQMAAKSQKEISDRWWREKKQGLTDAKDNVAGFGKNTADFLDENKEAVGKLLFAAAASCVKGLVNPLPAPVEVDGYTRTDGTEVRPHTRRAPNSE